jgi:hypothetical protein
MKVRQLTACLAVAGLLAISTAMARAQKDAKSAEAVAEIRKLGGKVDLDEERPDHPAIKVDLRRTKVTDKDLEHLKNLKHLQILYLNHTGIGDEGLEHLTGLNDLHTLSIHSTKMTDKGLAHVAKMPNLRVLIICGNPITDEGLQQLRAMSNLQEIYIYATKVSATGAKGLRAELPKTRIEGK